MKNKILPLKYKFTQLFTTHFEQVFLNDDKSFKQFWKDFK